ncbi:MAG: hypothetical protein GC182_16340 [Rhodopseudomonas sp.]|nr:hypothetical protein [Rhodopseudomonas sp.]
MTRQADEHHNDPVVTAIERVLKSERDGVEMLRQRSEQARQVLAAARDEASAIARRAENCATKLHTRYLEKLQTEIQRLTENSAPQSDNVDSAVGNDDEALIQAVRRVAATLTGGP